VLGNSDSAAIRAARAIVGSDRLVRLKDRQRIFHRLHLRHAAPEVAAALNYLSRRPVGRTSSFGHLILYRVSFRYLMRCG
jgi:hypothetical protein